MTSWHSTVRRWPSSCLRGLRAVSLTGSAVGSVLPIPMDVDNTCRSASVSWRPACSQASPMPGCAVRALGAPPLPPMEEPERRVLARLRVDPTLVRLACQLRPLHDVSVLPLVPPDAQAAFLHRRQQLAMPHEQF